MFSSRFLPAAVRAGLCALLLAACGGSDSATTQTKGAADSLVLVVDFEKKRFELVQGSVRLWSATFFNPDSADVPSWVEAFGAAPEAALHPLAENTLLRSRKQLSDSVMAIVADASGFDAHLLTRRIPARFILRWEDAALEVKSPVSAGGTSLREVWQDARSTARRLFGEAQLTVHVDSLSALTLQRVAVPPLATRVRPARKR